MGAEHSSDSIPSDREVDYVTKSRTFVSELESSDEERFELVCNELGNKSARKILKLISEGVTTSTELAEATGLSLQNVITHLKNLEKIGLVEKDHDRGLSSDLLRGRTAKKYHICKIAVLLVPNELNNKATIKKIVDREVLKLVRERITVSVSIAIGWAVTFFFLLSYLFHTSLAPFIKSGVTTSTSTTTTMLTTYVTTAIVNQTTIVLQTTSYGGGLNFVSVTVAVSSLIALISGIIVFIVSVRLSRKWIR